MVRHLFCFGLLFSSCLGSALRPILHIRANSTANITATPSFKWVALGDSYAAGVGAGDVFAAHDPEPSCYRTTGSYPNQLAEDFPYGPSEFQFLACTGAKTPDVINKQIPDLDGDENMVTLSIGGNDVGFSKILKACVFKPGGPISDDCDETIDKTWDYLSAGEDGLEGALFSTLDALFAKLPQQSWSKVLVTTYPEFFNDQTDWCDDQSMGIIPGFRPKLTKRLRDRLNKLSVAVTSNIGHRIDQWVERKRRDDFSEDWRFSRIQWDWTYNRIGLEGHRFCEQGVESFDDPSVWFFALGGSDVTTTSAGNIEKTYDPKTCYNSSQYTSNEVFSWNCDLARGLSASNVTRSTKVVAGDYAIRAFHPKSVAYTHIKDRLRTWIQDFVPPATQNLGAGGMLTCNPPHTAGNATYYFSWARGNAAMQEFCAGITNKNLSTVTGNYSSTNHGVELTITKDEPYALTCPDFHVAGPQASTEECLKQFTPIVLNCTTSSALQTTQGGSLNQNCVTWQMGVPAEYAVVPTEYAD